MRTNTTRTRAARTALVIGSAFAAPAAIVGVASAVSSAPTESAPRPLTDGLPAAAVHTRPADDADADASRAFWDAGYQYCDAERLAAEVGGDTWEAKLSVGRAVRSGTTVTPPTGCVDAVDTLSVPEAADLDAFWDAGYQYCDAEALAASLEVDGPYEAKVAIGAAVRSGADVPVPTGCD